MENEDKNIGITVYLTGESSDKYHTDHMTLEDAKKWVKKFMKTGDVYMVWDFDANKEINF